MAQCDLYQTHWTTGSGSITASGADGGSITASGGGGHVVGAAVAAVEALDVRWSRFCRQFMTAKRRASTWCGESSRGRTRRSLPSSCIAIGRGAAQGCDKTGNPLQMPCG